MINLKFQTAMHATLLEHKKSNSYKFPCILRMWKRTEYGRQGEGHYNIAKHLFDLTQNHQLFHVHSEDMFDLNLNQTHIMTDLLDLALNPKI